MLSEKHKLSMHYYNIKSLLTWYDLWCLFFHSTRATWATTTVMTRMNTISECIASWPLCFSWIFTCSILYKKNNNKPYLLQQPLINLIFLKTYYLQPSLSLPIFHFTDLPVSALIDLTVLCSLDCSSGRPLDMMNLTLCVTS